MSYAVAVQRTAGPEISVVMSVFNGERYLREAIDSVLQQSFEHFELVVVDDGSTDSTPEILSSIAARDPRVVVRPRKSINLPDALNFGFDVARAQLIARLDADDTAMPNRLEQQRAFFAQHPEVGLLGGQAAFTDQEGREFAVGRYPLSDAEIRKAFETTTPFVHSAVMMRRDAFEAAGRYRPIFTHSEDLDLWLRISERYEVANLDEVVVNYRMHASQESVRKQEDQALYSVASRTSARARANGQGDPMDSADRIDEALLLSLGTSEEEIAARIVRASTWMGKTLGRAGLPDRARELFDIAYSRARSDGGSPQLVAHVDRARAQRHAEEGHRVRAKLIQARARLAERRG
jgi:glycosyltransferase involved in cell wall biosynthesis